MVYAALDEEKYPPTLRYQDLDPLIARLDKNLLQLTPVLAQNDAAVRVRPAARSASNTAAH